MKTGAERRRQAEKRGREGEARAAMMLRLKGYRILEQRWKSGVGEIDLVVGRGNVVAFVEVKCRVDRDRALESISQRQRSRIVAAANCWLAANPDAAGRDCRFDIVAVTPYQWPVHIANAFDAGN